MRRSLIFCFAVCLGATLALASSSFAAPIVVLADDFSGPDGDLVGTTPDIGGTWGQTGTNSTNPIQVSGGKAAIGPANQDAYAAFSTPIPHNDGTTIHSSMDLNVSAAQATGDYFFHLSDPVATTSFFFQRLGAVVDGTDSTKYHLTLLETGGGGGVTTVGAGLLSLGTTYDVDVLWNFVPGATNDTFEVLVNGASYLTKTWTSTNGEPTAVSAGNFRQGTGSVAPTVTVDNLVVEVPEPATFVLCGLAGLFALGCRRQRG